MKGHDGDWIDLLARRSAGAVAAAERQPEPAPPAAGEPLSRAAAIKLALAGAAALSLGLRRVPQAQAEDRGRCFADCLDSYERALQRQRKACSAAFDPVSVTQSGGDAWRALRTMFRYGALSFVWDVGAAGLAGVCDTTSELIYRRALDDCYRHCEKRPKQPAPPPPEPTPPPVPPAPSPADDPCWACAQAGGKCCYASVDRDELCVCANPSIECKDYGC